MSEAKDQTWCPDCGRAVGQVAVGGRRVRVEARRVEGQAGPTLVPHRCRAATEQEDFEESTRFLRCWGKGALRPYRSGRGHR